MGRPKPKEWQPKGLDLILVRGLFSDSDCDEMLSIIGGRARARADEARERIVEVAGWLNAELHYSGRPNNAEKRAGIKPVAAALAKLEQCLTKLDADSVSLLRRVAGRNPCNPQKEPRSWASSREYPSALGLSRYEEALNGLRLLAGWTESALEQVATQKPGRPSLDPARHAAFRLLGIWKDYAGDPTFAPFLKVLRLAALPVFATYNQKPDLGRAAKDVLYGNWKPGKQRDKKVRSTRTEKSKPVE